MHERLTWDPIDPAPYESAWSVFIKLMALNFCKPADIAESIRRSGTPPARYLDFRDSNWIDFEHYGAMIGVDPNRLRTGFLDQLGFPQFIYHDDPHGIRFCLECLKFGYHSILFDLALVAECPIHRKPLEKGCTICCTTVASSGLAREPVPYRLQGGVIHDTAWRSDTYLSRCKHVHFDPETVLGIRHLDFDDRREMRKACDRLIQWWGRAFANSYAAPALVARLAQRSYEDREKSTLGLSLDIARTLAGSCPWTTSVAPTPASWITFRRRLKEADDKEGRIKFDSERGRIFRSVRRHIFDKYIRPSHLSCWHELSAYEFSMSRAMCRGSVCTAVLAYMSWRMSIEGFSNIEVFDLKKPHKPDILPIGFTANTATEVANFWYAQFFAILGRIEEMVRAGGHFYIERSERHAWFAGYSVLMPVEEQNCHGETWWIAYPNKEHATRIAAARCFGRSGRSETMLSVSAADQMYSWWWTGLYSSFDRPNLLFRIKDDASFSRSYRYLCI